MTFLVLQIKWEDWKFSTLNLLSEIIQYWINVNFLFLDVDECKEQSNICDGGQCRNLAGSYSCRCDGGLTASPDQKRCIGNLALQQLVIRIAELGFCWNIKKLMIFSFKLKREGHRMIQKGIKIGKKWTLSLRAMPLDFYTCDLPVCVILISVKFSICFVCPKDTSCKTEKPTGSSHSG